MTRESALLGTGLISDAADTLGLPSCAVGGFRLTHPDSVIQGRAFTLRQVLIEDAKDGVARQGEIAEHHLSPGDVLVISVPQGAEIATWGEGHTMRALGSRAGGIVVDGAIRDVKTLSVLPLPILFRSSTPLRSKGRLVTAEIGGTVTIGHVTINAGDFVCFDADGLVVLPAASERAVLAKAHEIECWEKRRNAVLGKRLQ